LNQALGRWSQVLFFVQMATTSQCFKRAAQSACKPSARVSPVVSSQRCWLCDPPHHEGPKTNKVCRALMARQNPV
jgi:hypothetical protein